MGTLCFCYKLLMIYPVGITRFPGILTWHPKEGEITKARASPSSGALKSGSQGAVYIPFLGGFCGHRPAMSRRCCWASLGPAQGKVRPPTEALPLGLAHEISSQIVTGQRWKLVSIEVSNSINALKSVSLNSHPDFEFPKGKKIRIPGVLIWTHLYHCSRWSNGNQLHELSLHFFPFSILDSKQVFLCSIGRKLQRSFHVKQIRKY